VPAAWDASDVVRRDAAEDALRQHPAQPDAGVEKSADQARDGQALDARFQPEEQSIAILGVPASAAEPCRPGVAQSAERSCAAPEAVEQLRLEAPQDAAAQPEVQPELVERRPMP
jgi:hypothetical protein